MLPGDPVVHEALLESVSQPLMHQRVTDKCSALTQRRLQLTQKKNKAFTIAQVSRGPKTYLTPRDTYDIRFFIFPEENAHTKLIIMMQGCSGCF